MQTDEECRRRIDVIQASTPNLTIHLINYLREIHTVNRFNLPMFIKVLLFSSINIHIV